MADLLVVQMGGPRFSWGLKTRHIGTITTTGELRKNYLTALREADQNNCEPLMRFAKS
ncbi:MAG: hypothetical protein WCK49_00485 [Myxococcaceae bacterium]